MKTTPSAPHFFQGLFLAGFLGGLVLLGGLAPLGAQEAEALFDDFTLLVEEEDSQLTETGFQDFLTNEAPLLGGSFYLQGQGALSLKEGTSLSDTLTSAQLKGVLFLDARPDPDFRFFAKGEVEYLYDGTSTLPQFRLMEIFTDIPLGEGVQMRAGKQALKWGVGYQFSPADLVSLSRLNPADPEATREGPIALKLQKAFGSTTLQLIVPMDEMFKGGKPALAPKVEFLLGNTELGLSGLYQYDKPSSLAATVSTNVWGLDLYGEAVAQYGSSVKILQYTGPLLTAAYKPDQWYPLATAGTRFNWTDDDGWFNLFFNAQYSFNSQGYSDTAILKDPQLAPLIFLNTITSNDLRNPGIHYLGAFLNWSKIFTLPFNFGAFGTYNLSDNTGIVDVNLTLTTLEKLTLALGLTSSYGEAGGQFTSAVPNPVLYLRVKMGTGEF